VKPNHSIHDDVAYQFFYRQKWPDGFLCPSCGHRQAYTIHSRVRSLPLYQCKLCRHQTTLTAGTILEGSRTSLFKWRKAIELVSTKASVNAVQLAALIHVTYKTSWKILNKIRHAISDLDNERRMAGYVTGGVVFYGRPPYVYFRTKREHPLWVSCAQERQVRRDHSFEDNCGLYVKIKCLTDKDLDGQKLTYSGEKKLFEEHLESHALGSTLNRVEFRRDPFLHPIYCEAKNWINDTFKGIGRTYQQHYWDEYCFRLNYMHSDTPLIHILTSICMKNISYFILNAHVSS